MEQLCCLWAVAERLMSCHSATDTIVVLICPPSLWHLHAVCSAIEKYFLLHVVIMYSKCYVLRSQAMHLVYRALEKEPVPALLPASLVPLSKRKKSLGSVGTAVPGLPASPPPPKDSLRSTPSHGSMNSLNSAGSLSPKHSLKSGQVTKASCPQRRFETDRKCGFSNKTFHLTCVSKTLSSSKLVFSVLFNKNRIYKRIRCIGFSAQRPQMCTNKICEPFVASTR